MKRVALIQVAKELTIVLAESGASPVSDIRRSYNNDNNNIKHTNIVAVVVVLLWSYLMHEIYGSMMLLQARNTTQTHALKRVCF